MQTHAHKNVNGILCSKKQTKELDQLNGVLNENRKSEYKYTIYMLKLAIKFI